MALPQKKLRNDPKPRPTDALSNAFEIINPDPKKHYVAVDEHGSRNMFGVEYYRALGYDVEVFDANDKDSVRFRRGTTVRHGDALATFGHVLMSMDKATHREMEHGGQQAADLMEKQIVTKRGLRDHFRGIGINKNENWVEVQNETSSLESHLSLG